MFPDEDLPTKGTVETAEETVEKKLEENAGPFEHASGSAGLSVEFIGANARELTFLALNPNAAPPPGGNLGHRGGGGGHRGRPPDHARERRW